jgi:beta-lactamase superfamily II metal-dependent hydrolase
MAHRFAGLGANGRKLYLFEADRTTRFRQVLWGDFLTVLGEEPDGWLRIRWAPNSPDAREVFIRKDDTVETRPLEIIFVDVGQGDGAVLITPERGEDERIIVIDAGERDNMLRFLNARFKAYRGFDFHAAVLTHPDQDHYQGFLPIFSDPDVGFGTVFHSGLVERPVSGEFEKVGGLHPDPVTGVHYVQDLAIGRAEIEQHFADDSTFGQMKFPRVMHAALNNARIGNFAMLTTAHGQLEDGRSYVPGLAPSNGRGYTIQVVGPIVEPAADGRPRLRKLGGYGETKNGHSVLLKLVFNRFAVLLGGDLNDKAEKFLLQQYAGLDSFPARGSAAYADMIAEAARTFRCEVLKVCHHGSEKVTDAFLETVNPACFIVSSGDQEGHVHPRPDLLGRLGRFGRGDAPVILATELQRSTREVERASEVESIQDGIAALRDTPTDALRDRLREAVEQLARTNVEVYGAIYVKTDGDRLITAFKLEEPSPTKRWFYFEYVFTAGGELKLVH